MAMSRTPRPRPRFALALQSGELTTPDLLEQMRTTVGFDRYGLGLEKRRTLCGVVWGHPGSLPGYTTHTYTDSAGTRTLSILVSTTFGIDERESAAAYDELLHGAVCAMFDEPVPNS